MPDYLAIEMENFIKSIYGIKTDDRIFTISKSYLHHEMDRGAKLAGVKRIRIHGLRHSNISLLINLGFSALAIGERVGHEAVDIQETTLTPCTWMCGILMCWTARDG